MPDEDIPLEDPPFPSEDEVDHPALVSESWIASSASVGVGVGAIVGAVVGAIVVGAVVGVGVGTDPQPPLLSVPWGRQRNR